MSLTSGPVAGVRVIERHLVNVASHRADMVWREAYSSIARKACVETERLMVDMVGLKAVERRESGWDRL
jgi:hypothetical protein